LDLALAQTDAAIAEARTLAHAPSLAASLAFGTHCNLRLGNLSASAELADELIAVAIELGFLHWRAQGTICRGWAKFKIGDVTEGMSLLRNGLDTYRATGAEQYIPEYLTLMALAYEIDGQIEEGLALLDDALRIVKRTGERWFIAELNRQKASCSCSKGMCVPQKNSIATL
jgi:predicted ATPase